MAILSCRISRKDLAAKRYENTIYTLKPGPEPKRRIEEVLVELFWPDIKKALDEGKTLSQFIDETVN